MNKNDYRRALIMLRSLRTGVSGYVRLERRTLIGTLHFTINGAPEDGALYAVLLYRQNGAWRGVRAGELAAPRYGQTGLVWKFDPRNIEGRTLEQFDLAAIIEIRSGICDLVLCGNLNGSVEADWAAVREAACRLFTPVRIAGMPITPIDEAEPSEPPSSEPAAQPDKEPPEDLSSCSDSPAEEEISSSAADPAASEPIPEPPIAPAEADDSDIPAEEETCADHSSEPEATEPEATELDMPAEYPPEQLIETAQADEIDIPAEYLPNPVESDEIDTPAQDYASTDNTESIAPERSSPDDSLTEPVPDDNFPSAGDLLKLADKNAPWPACIAPLRDLFFSSKPVYPFEAEGYVFIQAPLPESSDTDICFIGLYCEEGVPARVCYALPSPYSPEPPVGLEGYVWRGESSSGCWAICEAVTP